MTVGDALNVLDLKVALPPEWRSRKVAGIVHDSRNVVPGALFVAVRGFHSDGHQFIPQALRQGAAAVIAEDLPVAAAVAEAPVFSVPDSRAALALLSAAFYGHPSQRLALVGITGTNGKTTTSYLARAIIEASGGMSGLIGTIDYRIGTRVYPAPNTTPESVDLQRLLAEMADQGAGYCVMEVSSHALALKRTLGCRFASAAFTNLSQDHLDFHGDMDAYFRAKLLLFTGLAPNATAVVNCDDARADEIIAATNARVVTFGLSERAEIRPLGPVIHGIDGLSFSARTPAGTVAVNSPLVGRHNVYNILTALGIGASLGFGPGVLARGIAEMRAVPGRMEKVEAGQPFSVFVDYAHTEDALDRLLEAVREVAPRRVITLFGCGGDRDRAKRPRMGGAAIKGSDAVIITSDNPRSEDPLGIISEIEDGLRGAAARVDDAGGLRAQVQDKKPYCVIPDRREAIAAAVEAAEAGDVVVLAGKGHEDYQVLGAKKIHFDDREEARKAIEALRG